MAEIAKPLGQAAEAAKKKDARKLFTALLAAWERKPAAALAEVFTAASVSFPSSFEGDTQAWVNAAKRDGPEVRGGLLTCLVGPAVEDTRRRLVAALQWGMDPRISAAVEAMLREVPYTSSSSRTTWREAFTLMTAQKDARFVLLAAELPPGWTIREDQKVYLSRQLRAHAAKLPQQAPTLSDAEREALAAVLAALPKPAPKVA